MKTLILLLTLFSSLAMADIAPAYNNAATPDDTDKCLEFAKTLKPSLSPCMYVSDVAKYYLTKGQPFEAICQNPTDYKAAALEMVNAKMCPRSELTLSRSQMNVMAHKETENLISSIVTAIVILIASFLFLFTIHKLSSRS